MQFRLPSSAVRRQQTAKFDTLESIRGPLGAGRLVALLLGLSLGAGCGGGGSSAPPSGLPVVVTLSPTAATVEPGASEHFIASVSGGCGLVRKPRWGGERRGRD